MPGMSESTATTGRIIKFSDPFPMDLDHGQKNHLRDSRPGFYHEPGFGPVPARDKNLSLVITVYQPDKIA